MEQIRLNTTNIAAFSGAKPCVLALGFFDGVHRGHQRVIAMAKQLAVARKLPLAVMTFDQHASQVFASPASARFRYLTTLTQKAAIMAQLGVDRLYVVHFDAAFARRAPAAFVTDYLVKLRACQVVAGFDYTFGQGGRAGVQTLTHLAAKRFETTVVSECQQGCQKISSTRIRQLVATGKLEAAEALLGHPYQVALTALGEALVPVIAQQLPPAGFWQATTATGEQVLVHLVDQRVYGLAAAGIVQLRFEPAQIAQAFG